VNPRYSDYVDSLIADLRFELGLVEGRVLDSIFIGGGTPSLFPASQINRLLAAVSDLLGCRSGMEVTLEANPGTLEAGRFAAYREAGVNRLSIGAQSFNARALQNMGRIHGPEQVIHAVSQARAGGFKNINLDLMFGLPGQSLEEARCDVEVAIELDPEHISYYQLTIEPNTQFAVSPPVLPSDERLWDIQRQGQALLGDAGYRQYEISAYSMVDKQCRHNLNYWNFGDYLGIGAGAHGKISDSETQRVTRRSRVRGPALYLEYAGSKHVLSSDVHINEEGLMLEFMMNLLRLNAGFTEALFQDRTGISCARVQPVLLEAQLRGLLQLDLDRIKPTQLGHRYLNDLLGLFV